MPASSRLSRHGLHRFGSVSLVILALVLAGSALLVGGPGVGTAASGSTRVTLCHQTGNGSYRVITVSASAVINGHGHHPGDIIPAVSFERGQQSIHFAGRNLGTIRSDGLTGAQVLAAGCSVPPRATQPPDVSVTASTGVPEPTETAPTQTAATVPPTEPPPTEPPPTEPPPTEPPPTEPPPTEPPPTEPPPTEPPPTEPTAPTTVTTSACPPGELEHDGACFAIPPLVIPTATSTPGASTAVPTPIVECVDRRGDGVTVVWFDYELAGTEPVTVDRGPQNSMSPEGVPPTLFGPGLHQRVVGVETLDGIASWTLGTTTVTSGDTTPSCSGPTEQTSVPGTTDAPATNSPSTGSTDSSPSTTQVEPTATSEPTETDPPASGGQGSCEAGERQGENGCEPVEAVRLVLVDNVMECDGHAVARFAAFNDNPFPLDTDDLTSTVSPNRHDGSQPTVLDERVVESDDLAEVAELFTVRYVTAVMWTIQYHGIEESISAGVSHATPNPDCPLASIAATGVGHQFGPPLIPATGGGVGWLALVAIGAATSGVVLVLAASRRRPGSAPGT